MNVVPFRKDTVSSGVNNQVDSLNLMVIQRTSPQWLSRNHPDGLACRDVWINTPELSSAFPAVQRHGWAMFRLFEHITHSLAED